MHPSRSRTLSARTVLPVAGAGLLLLGAAGPASAASAKPAKLVVTSLSSPPATVAPGTAFTVTGKVRNTGGRTSRALVAVRLRAGKRPTVAYALAGGSLAKVRPGGTRGFKVRVVVPKDARGADSGRPFVLEACAGTSRGAAKVSCRTAKRRALLRVPAAPKPPAPAPPAPAPPADPTVPAPPADPTVFTPGARTLGDTLFPTIGNGGYDARHYDLDLKYGVTSKFLRGTVTMTAEATQNLSSFSLDLTEWNEVNRVTVDGVEASFAQDPADDKLVVTPPTGLRAGSAFEVAVTYSGVQQPYIDPDGSQEGWVPSTTYGAIVVSEPVGAMGWFPNNNVPFDKATYGMRITVPTGWKALATGVLKERTDHDAETTWVWDNTDPTSSYLYSVAIGKYDTTSLDPAAPQMTAPAPGSLNPPVPFYTAIDSSFTTNKAAMVAKVARTPEILDFFAGYYGVPYAFSSAGGVTPRQNVQYSLETQGRPIYAVSSTATTQGVGIDTVAHENGHMWFGDNVTLSQWKDIWLNEGMTEFSTWLWSNAEDGGPSTDDQYATRYAYADEDEDEDGVPDHEDFWAVAPAAPPTSVDIFNSDAMYERGAATMAAIRALLSNGGDDARFRTMMRRWLTEHTYGNATTEQFIALVKETDPSRADRWTAFFRQWLYTSYPGTPGPNNRPQMNVANFDTYDITP